MEDIMKTDPMAETQDTQAWGRPSNQMRLVPFRYILKKQRLTRYLDIYCVKMKTETKTEYKILKNEKNIVI